MKGLSTLICFQSNLSGPWAKPILPLSSSLVTFNLWYLQDHKLRNNYKRNNGLDPATKNYISIQLSLVQQTQLLYGAV